MAGPGFKSGRLTPDAGAAYRVMLPGPGPAGLSWLSHNGTELCDLEKVAKPQPTHLQNEGMGQDKWGAFRGCHSDEKDKWSSE